MADHFNQLSPAEAELLALLSEECGEGVQAVGKILRHGLESFNPDLLVNQRATGPAITNRNALEKELGDIMAAMFLMTKAGMLDGDRIRAAQQRKLDRLDRYFHHNNVFE